MYSFCKKTGLYIKVTTKENNGEVYFSCYVVWMYVLLPPCTRSCGKHKYISNQKHDDSHFVFTMKKPVQEHSYATFFCTFFSSCQNHAGQFVDEVN